MRVLSLLTALCLATTAYANAIRGGYERLWFWHIYSLEIQQYGVGNTWIANGCRGTGGLACNFNDFIKHINNLQNLPSISTADIPNMDGTARALTRGFTGPQLPNRVTGSTGYIPMMKKVGETIEALYPNIDRNSRHYTEALRAALGVKLLRDMDYQSYRTTAINAELKTNDAYKNVKWVEETNNFAGSRWTKIDLEATAASPDNKNIAGLKAAFDTWDDAYKVRGPAVEGGPSPASHWAALDRALKSESATRSGVADNTGVERPYNGC